MPFETEIKAAAEKHKVPYALLYEQVRQESNFKPLAVSHCGARGLLQIMPSTGLGLGLKEDEFFDVEKNLDAGARYLRSQYLSCKRMIETMPKGATNACTDGDYWMLGLASYNGGIGYTLKTINLCMIEGLSIRWENCEGFYADERCAVRGKRPDHKQITDYVRRIWTKYKTELGKTTTTNNPDAGAAPSGRPSGNTE
jgi:hypothetical protein